MNCSRVLPAFIPPPQQPMDLALQLCLSQSQPLYHLLTMSTLRPLKALRPEPSRDTQRPDCSGSPFSSLSSSPSSTPSSSPDSSLTWEPRSSLRRRGAGSVKKRVVFADARGLALTEVQHFVPEPAQSTVSGTLSRTRHQLIKPQLPCSPLAARPQVPATVPAPGSPPGSPPVNATAAGKLRQYQLKLASTLPTPDFSSGLKDAQVRLESCSVTERGLMGSVRVARSSGGGERAVHVRLTFDSWRSHRDVPCTLLLQNCGNTQTDVFAFHLPLPRTLLDPSAGVEFCFFVRVARGGVVKVYWDNNTGKNYRVVCMEREDSKQTHSRTGSVLLPTSSSSSSPVSSPTLAMKNYMVACMEREDSKQMHSWTGSVLLPTSSSSSSPVSSPTLAMKNYRVACMEREDSKQMHSWPGSVLLPTSSSSSPVSSPTLAMKNYRVACMEREDSKQMHSWTAKPGSVLLPISSSASPSSSPTLALKNNINARPLWSGAAGSWNSSGRPAGQSL